MKILKRLFTLCLALSLLFVFAAGAQAQYSIAALKGPTAMGLAKMIRDHENDDAYAFTIAASADAVTPALLKGEIDMACIPTNLAAVLYNKTGGEIQVLAINTLGVLYIVENGDTLQSIDDLRGQTIVAAGKDSTPEYALRYLLRENGIDPDRDSTIDWKSEQTECVAALAAGQATIALLPQPFVTAAQSKIEGLRMAIDLNEVWNALDNGSALITGVIVARRQAVEENPEAARAFLREYAESVAWTNENAADAAAIIGEYGIVDAPIAERALPHCNIVCITGAELPEKLRGYLQVLYNADPAAIGGAMPDDDFYFE
ncbi:MAG: ABC transporter substrate-binding protein [Clostridia bacterium]|nr:ABC transporter substrate-binding protein [Clostridia bacterium]